MSNENLRKAKKVKNDEFYTLYEDIENELVHYKPELINKIIYCNCDNPEISNFWKYFVDNFEELKIYKVISTHFNKDNSQSYKIEFNGKEKLITPLKGNGDFKSEECIEILKESDIVITNPPFSLFRDFIKTLMKYKKGFLIIGNINAITKRDIFPYVKNDIIKIGINKIKSFIEPNGNIKKMGNVYWYTTLKNDKVYQPFISLKKYNPDEYQKYDNYDAINVDRVKDIPCDYYGTIGVPISFIEKYIPSDFTLEDAINRYSILQGVTEETKGKYMTKIWGVQIYSPHYQEDMNLYMPIIPQHLKDMISIRELLSGRFRIVGVTNGGVSNDYISFTGFIKKKKTFTRLLIKKQRS